MNGSFNTKNDEAKNKVNY